LQEYLITRSVNTHRLRIVRKRRREEGRVGETEREREGEGWRKGEGERERGGKMRIGCVGHHQEQYRRDGPCLVICADNRPAPGNILEIWRPHLQE
jgi:hypothetical protein